MSTSIHSLQVYELVNPLMTLVDYEKVLISGVVNMIWLVHYYSPTMPKSIYPNVSLAIRKARSYMC